MVTVIDTWSYADGIVVGVAQTTVSLPTVRVVPMAEHVDGHTKPSPYQPTLTAIRKEPTGSIPTTVQRR
jgi:hypothetical protein